MDSLLNKLKTNLPRYTITQPSTHKKVKFRPFTVKEEKALLISKTTSSYSESIDTLSNLIDACFDLKVNVKDLPYFDVEYFFIMLRSKSVGEEVETTFTCPTTGEKIKKVINLEEIKPKYFDSHSDTITIGSDLRVKMRYPTIGDILENDKLDYYNLILSCIESIETEEELIECKDYPKQKLEELVDLLTKDQFNKLIEFFKTMPRIECVVNYETKDGESREIIVKGLRDFFQFASTTQI